MQRSDNERKEYNSSIFKNLYHSEKVLFCNIDKLDKYLKIYK